MVNPEPGQEAVQNSPPSLPVLPFRHPDVLVSNLTGVISVDWFARSQDGEIGVDQHLGVGILVGNVRLRFPNESSNQMAFWDRQFLAQPLGILGASFLAVRSLA